MSKVKINERVKSYSGSVRATESLIIKAVGISQMPRVWSTRILSSFLKSKYLAFQKVFRALKEEIQYLKISHSHIQMARINIMFLFINVNLRVNYTFVLQN